MSSPTKQRSELKRLYESALEIVEERKLYDIQRQVKKGSADGFGDYVRQNFDTQIYEQWWLDLQETFARAGLNFLKFKKKVYQREPDKTQSIFPPGYLLFAVDELEALLTDKEYLDSYRLSAKAVQTWPVVDYSDGVVNNGVEVHNFNRSGNKDAIALLDSLWEAREIKSPTKAILKPGKSVVWSKSGVKNIGSGKATANSVNKAMRTKGIELRVKFPKNTNGVYLSVTQKSTK